MEPALRAVESVLKLQSMIFSLSGFHVRAQSFSKRNGMQCEMLSYSIPSYNVPVITPRLRANVLSDIGTLPASNSTRL